MTNALFLRKLLFWPQPWAAQVFMLLWVSLLILAPVGGQFATEIKSVISLHPPWTTLFKGETVTLTCKAFQINAPQKIKWYRWYLPGEIQYKTTGNTYEVHESGGYKCQAQDSHSSDRVDLIFSAANLILQAPSDVFEEDSVVLRCQAKANIVLNNMTLYKNGKILKILNKTSDFRIHQASMKDSGEYYCSGVKDTHSVSSNKIQIVVQELFPSPVLRASSTQPTEGHTVTLTCESQLSLQRPEGQLQFRFVKPSTMSEWRISPEFQFSPIRRENSGSYWCEARRINSLVQKRSQELQIQVQEIVPDVRIHSHPEFVFEGLELVLICSVSGVPRPTISWYKKQHRLRKDRELQTSSETEFKVPVVQNSDAGEYYCIARNSRFSIKSNSVIISVKVPVSQPVLTLRPLETWTLVREMSLQCEVQRGSLPIRYQFFHEDVLFKEIKSSSGRKVLHRLSPTEKPFGSYYCTADNGLGPQRSAAVMPVSQPVLTLSPPGTRTLVGNEVRLQCEVQRGSSPIQYQFFHEDVLLTKIEATSWRTKSYSFSVTAEHSGNYYCTADNGFGPQSSETINLSVIVPVSRPVLTLRTPRAQAVVGDVVQLHCEAQRGSPPILYQFYHEDVTLGSSSSPSGEGASFNLFLKTEHSGNYFCEANNGQGVQRSYPVSLSVKVPVSHPVLTLRTPRVQAVVGDILEIHCETQRGSPPIQYQFYRENVALGSCSSLSGGGTSFNLSLTTEHSGNYSCEADNGLGVQRSEAVSLSVKVPVSRPVLTLRTARAQVVVGDVLELRCEAQRGSPPILYWFYHNNVTLETSTSHSGQGVSLNLSLTAGHSGTYSCEVDNGLGPQHSEAVTLFVMGLTGSKSSLIATSVTGGLLSVMAVAAVALLFYCWLLRKAGGKPTFDSSRNPSAPDPQESTYYNVPGWIELQPVYSNVNPNRGEVVYSEVWSVKKENKLTAASEPEPFKKTVSPMPCAPSHLRPTDLCPSPVCSFSQDSCVIYSQVKGASTAASKPQFLDPLTPHR
ncbi:Fc receptor-like protein 5 isoform X6 [Ovis aries]|uniref:Fc receptor-like protein 5 isoform X6 n=1 Tax=Ovis aries TaxID=9940 RepID=UPI00295283B9|nr:Fc receptor-like protein 5 isoform X6 [Ovis aries]